MDQVRLGNNGLHVSRLCLGMMSYYSGTPRQPWMLDEKAAEPILRRAVEGGITFFDTADMYSDGGSELTTGGLLGMLFAREEVVVATKVYFPMTPGPNGGGLNRKHILSAIPAGRLLAWPHGSVALGGDSEIVGQRRKRPAPDARGARADPACIALSNADR
jgi:1-deoxyxylulose-5-phosphate synthase